jgi:thiol-disulfide isomerase/thioredoxin
LVAVGMPLPDDDNHDESIKVFAAPEWEEKCKIPFDSKTVRANPGVFAGADRILVGTVTHYEKPNDWKHFDATLKFWDVTSGEETLSIPSAAKDQGFGWVKASPDGQMVVASTFARPSGRQERLLIIDVAKKTWVEVSLAALIQQPLFHPSGKWVVVPTQIVPADAARDVSAEELQQPRIEVIDLAKCEILETLVAPQTFINSLAFSPDGTTLATSGHGEVLMWDFHRPPGSAPPSLEKLVGQPMEIVGQTASGAVFNGKALRGKVVLVDFWATWCRSCVAEMPHIRSLYEDFRERGFEVVGINVDDAPLAVVQFAKDQGIPWPMLTRGSADDSITHHPMALKYGIESLPATFLIGADGNVAAVNLPRHQMRAKIEALLNAK